MEFTLNHGLTALLGYLLGSVPFGLVLTRLAGLGDVRDIGSGNIGATNVLRTGNKPLALATLLLDGGKGAIAVFIAMYWSFDLALIAGLFSVLGHNFPIWLKFKGGKGVATTLGVMLALSWQVGLLSCLTWLASALVFRYSSLAAIIAFSIAPIYTYYIIDLNAAIIIALLALLGIGRHHQNIGRLIKGEEPKIGKKKEG
ncbi:MAG: glycerol-3-phosphate 1-O-acyltransferase PlsY [Rhodospirillales bacterium]|nr:glycerol-3-phosphate 1-O-acyltransferase PlsY [Rhodospirillales bacterium]